MIALKIKITIIILFSIAQVNIRGDDSLENSITTLDEVVKTVSEITGPKNIKCQSSWHPYVIETPFLNELYAIEGKATEKVVTGRELVDHLKKRLSMANFEGTEEFVFGPRCTVDFDEKGDNVVMNFKNGSASIKK